MSGQPVPASARPVDLRGLRRRRLWLLLSDLTALAVFGLLGLASHDTLSWGGVVRSVLPFLVAWTALAPVLGAASEEGGPAWRRLLVAWAICAFVALGARALLFDRPFLSAFTVVSLVGGAFFLASSRGFYALVVRRTANG